MIGSPSVSGEVTHNAQVCTVTTYSSTSTTHLFLSLSLSPTFQSADEIMSGTATPTHNNEQAGGVSACLAIRESAFGSYIPLYAILRLLPPTRLGRPGKSTWILDLIPEIVRLNYLLISPNQHQLTLRLCLFYWTLIRIASFSGDLSSLTAPPFILSPTSLTEFPGK